MTPLFIIPAEAIGLFLLLTIGPALLAFVMFWVTTLRRERRERMLSEQRAREHEVLKGTSRRLAPPAAELPVLGGAWTPEEYVAFGHKDTDDLIKRIDDELASKVWRYQNAQALEVFEAPRMREIEILPDGTRVWR